MVSKILLLEKIEGIENMKRNDFSKELLKLTLTFVQSLKPIKRSQVIMLHQPC